MAGFQVSEKNQNGFQGNRQVHFSIDDVGRSLRWLTENKPKSIFDMRFFGTLCNWRTKYKLNVSLYCFSGKDGFSIESIPERYSEEFEKAKWLFWGYHGRDSGEPFFNNTSYLSEYQAFTKMAEKLHWQVTDIVRLHNWKATEEQKKFLSEQGIHILLYPNYKVLPYDDDDSFADEFITYWKTNVRFEHLDSINKNNLYIGKRRIVAFTHEREFDVWMRQIEEGIKIYHDEGYVFI